MTNAILKRLAAKGFITMRRVNSRNIQYAVTPEGVDAIARRSYRAAAAGERRPARQGELVICSERLGFSPRAESEWASSDGTAAGEPSAPSEPPAPRELRAPTRAVRAARAVCGPRASARGYSRLGGCSRARRRVVGSAPRGVGAAGLGYVGSDSASCG